jgi:hypothetical protein
MRLCNLVLDTPTFYAALDDGYTCADFTRIMHWDEPATSTTLFAEFVDFFFKLKNDAKASKNAGLATMAKYIINSLWGKFGQRQMNTKCEFVTANDVGKLIGLVQNPNILVRSIVQYNTPDGEPDMREVQYTPTSEGLEAGYNTTFSNVAIACFITAAARLRLHNTKKYLGAERVIYCDTDSIIFISWDGQPALEHAPTVLGSWSSELPKDASPIQEFVCVAPKAYCYLKADGDWCARLKGIRIAKETEEQVTFENIKAVLAGDIDFLSIPQSRLVKVSRHHEVISTLREHEDLASTVPAEEQELVRTMEKAHTAAVKNFSLPEQNKRALLIPAGCETALDAMREYGMIDTSPFNDDDFL